MIERIRTTAVEALLCASTAGVRKSADNFIAAHSKITADQKQMALMSLLNFYRPPQDNETVLKLMGEVKTLAPDSEAGK